MILSFSQLRSSAKVCAFSTEPGQPSNVAIDGDSIRWISDDIHPVPKPGVNRFLIKATLVEGM